MNDHTAERVANVILGAAVVTAAVVVLRTPPLRRLAAQLALKAVTGDLPAWFNGEVRRAWAASGQQQKPGTTPAI